MTPAVFFLHIPKTGGVSFEAVLSQLLGEAARCPAYYDDQLLDPDLDPAAYRLFQGHLSYFCRPLLPEPLSVVTLLRDPVERALSVYEHVLRDPDHPRHRLTMEQTASLSDFALHPLLAQEIGDVAVKTLGREAPLAAIRAIAATDQELARRGRIFLQFQRNLPATDQELERALARIETMAYCGFTPELEQACRAFCRHLGLPEIPPPHLNRTPPEVTARRAEAYTPEDRAAVEAINRRDRRLYDHARRRWALGGQH